MPQPIRTFIAVKIPSTPPLRQTIAACTAMGDAVKPVSPEQLHVTLKFLGDTDRDQLPAITEQLVAAASERPAFTLDVFGIGAFPHRNRPTVVWTGFRNADTLIDLAGDLETRLQEFGFPRERRAFHPHLTLARVRKRPPAALAELFARCEKTDFGSIPIREVRLYKSDLATDGPKYTLLAKAVLA